MTSSAVKLNKLCFFLPVLKPSGLCCRKLEESIKYEISNHFGTNHEFVKIGHYNSLEYFADGVITYRVGRENEQFGPHFKLGQSVIDTVIELGTSRRYMSIDGDINHQSEINHINIELIKTTLDKFKGDSQQKLNSHYLINPLGCPDHKLFSTDSENLNMRTYYDAMVLYDHSERLLKLEQRLEQKYPLVRPLKSIRTDKIELIDYIKPYLKLRLHGSSSVSVRQFAADLGLLLGTQASVRQKTRVMEGPMLKDDLRVIKMHELSFEHYMPIADGLRKLYEDYILSMEEAVAEYSESLKKHRGSTLTR